MDPTPRTRPGAAPTPGAPPPAGPYTPFEKLGSGGFGEVWKAWDTDLRRWVALKLLRVQDDEERLRFRREAQTAAALTHPNIVQVYAVGDGWIAMELVEGHPLSRARLAPRGAAQAVRDAALALDHAHAQGIIHRDLKPSNLMLDPAGRVRVMDFGLARRISGGSTLTTSGMMVGTPAYMSPEQARGDIHALDSRTDVYGLGATLYDLLSGRPPFTGENAVDIALRVLETDPPPLPVARDLATIVMKSLEKLPERRYRTARALADDLDRYLAGEPVTARPPSLLRRAAAAVRRKRPLAIALAAALALIAVVAGLSLPALRRRGEALERAEGLLSEREHDLSRAQRAAVDQMRVTAATCLEAALEMRRIGQLDAMRRQLANVEEACARARAAAPTLAEPHYRLGRMYRAILREQDALAEQDKALAKEPAYGPALYERAVLLARALRRRQNDLADRALRQAAAHSQRQMLEAIRDYDPRQATRLDDVARDLSDRLRADLARLADARLVDPGELASARGHRALTDDRYDEARRHFTAAVAANPCLEEVYAALGGLEWDLHEYARSADWYAAGVARDQGALPLVRGLAAARRAIADMHARANLPAADPAYLATIETYRRILSIEPGDADALFGIAKAAANRAIARDARGTDPFGLFDEALQAFDAAIAADPDRADVWAERGVARSALANALYARGRESAPLYRAALDDLDRAVTLAGRPEDRVSRGLARGNLAFSSADAGADPEPDYALAIQDFDEALRVDPASVNARHFRGVILVNRGLRHAQRNRDPQPAYRAAVADFDAIIALYPGNDSFLVQRALARLHWGNWVATSGDPEPHFRGALGDLDVALHRSPALDAAWSLRGRLRSDWGLHLAARGRDPVELYAAALRDFDRAIEINAARDDHWWGRGIARSNWSVWAGSADLATRAIADFDQALKLNPRRPDAWLARAVARTNLSHAIPDDAARPLEEAVRDLDEALRLSPGWPDALVRRAQARMFLALAVARSGADPERVYPAALADFDAALTSVPDSAEALIFRGGLRVNWANWRRNQRRDTGTLYRDAVRDLDAAIAREPSQAVAWQFRGNAFFNWARDKDLRQEPIRDEVKAALDSYVEAARLNPALESRVREPIAECRRHLQQ